MESNLLLFNEYFNSSALTHFYSSYPHLWLSLIDGYEVSCQHIWAAFESKNSEKIDGYVVPLWKYFNTENRAHYFSMNKNIHKTFPGWIQDNIVGWIYAEDGPNRFPVYRHWNGSNDYKYTSETLVHGFSNQGIAWYSPSVNIDEVKGE